MKIAAFEHFGVEVDGPYRDAPGITFDGVDVEDNNFQFVCPWQDVNGLILALQYAQRKRAAAEADGVVAAVLLQGHVAAAPGDFG